MDVAGALAEFDGRHVAGLQALAEGDWRGQDLRALEAAVLDARLGVAA